MAADLPLLTRQRVLAAAAETTTGTAASLAAADAAFNVFNATLEEDIPEIGRESQGTSLSPLPPVPGPRSARLRFSSYLHGNGSAGLPAWASTFLPACGMVASSQAYSFQSGNASAVTLTMGLYEDGVLRKIVGAVGTFGLTFIPGQPVRIDWEFLGKLADEADATILAPTYPTTIPPRWASNTLSVGGTPFTRVGQMTLAANNDMQLREDAADVTGWFSGVIVDRNPGGEFDPEATLVATKNWISELTAGTQSALSVAAGTVTNNIVTVTAPKLQVVQKRRGDRNKIMTNGLSYRLCRSASAGDDELVITFS